ncbi:hypothetical protein [Flavobacterium urocaniciphilum]|uniref:EF-hand domain-containing protein n=1 Tax=Flavobacterium urocaniciphilum TaxID=1299341 RepID=A0A1H9D0X8_9FLAO|nr:hypothetical protein [Flavobacterium urocaniciphilum]SEQ06418.1 hypothetical protein SAMN05444005_105169 [Flavobacterium urocaniciphilum]
MKNYIYILFVSSVMIFSCQQEKPKPKVKYNNTKETKSPQRDTSKLEVADLPIQFEGSNVLIYTIGNLTLGDINKKGTYESTSYEGVAGFNVSNSMDNEITGYLQNMKFQAIGSDSLHVLTDKVMLIERVSFVKNNKMLIYILADSDTNQDGVIDSNDIKSLYISSELGENFTKISTDLQELLDWKHIEAANKIFFRTVEDANKNGEFDKNDKIHYHFLNLKDNKVSEYFPL